MNSRRTTSLFLFISVIFILHSLYLAVPAEDSFIGFRYAKNIVDGHGLVWNPGENPVEGYTNFLWIIICSVGLYNGIDVILFAQFFGVISGVLTMLYVYNISKTIPGFDETTSLLPCFFLAISGPFATWASSGMETILFTFFVAGSIYHSFSTVKFGNFSSLNLSFLLALFATLTRPEGFGLFLFLVLFHVIFRAQETKKAGGWIKLLIAVLLFLIPFSLYFNWRYSYYGYILPLTFYAKTGFTFHQWIRGIKYIIYFSIHFLLPFLPLLIYVLLKKKDFNKFKNKSICEWLKNNFTRKNIYLLFCASFSLVYLFYIILVGGDYMAMYRFIVPILPTIYILLAYGFTRTWKPGQTIKANIIIVIIFMMALIGTVIQSTPLEKFIFRKPGITHGQYQGVLIERWNSTRLTLIGKFFNVYKKNADESLSTDAIGAISYYSNLKIYGWHGLDDPLIAKMKVDDMGRGFPGHEKSDLQYTLLKKPTYFMYSRELTMEANEFPAYSESVDNILRKEYDKVSVWLEDEINDESGYLTFLQRKDKTREE